MPSFSAASLARLGTCHPDLVRLFLEVVKVRDCTVLEGVRTVEQQIENVAKGVSRTMASKHLLDYSAEPALGVDAADVAPYPLRWPKKPADQSPAELTRWMKDTARFYYFSGYVMATAERLGIPLRYGGDWNSNNELDDQTFDDLPHYELVR